MRKMFDILKKFINGSSDAIEAALIGSTGAQKAALIGSTGAVIAAIIAVTPADNKSKLEGNNKPTSPVPTRSETPQSSSLDSPVATPSDSINKYLYRCTEESKKFDENQCKEVIQILTKKFPKIDVNNISWKYISEAYNSKVYNCGNVEEIIEAEFTINDETVNAEFNSKAMLLEIEYELKPIAELPEKVLKSLKDYVSEKNASSESQYKIPDFFELEEYPNTPKLSYEIEVNTDTDYDVTFNRDGNEIENECED